MSDLVGNTNCWFSHAKAHIPSTAVSMITVGKFELSDVILSSTVNNVELTVDVVSSTDGIVIPNPVTAPVMFDLHMIHI